jgi:uncharacterized protein YkwD
MRRRKAPPRPPVVAALFLALAVLQGKNSLYFHNGAGGKDWKIGQPQASLFNAHQTRSLPELQSLALELVNRDRRLNNLRPLAADALISRTAQRHAEDMASRDFYGHANPEGQTPSDRYQALGGVGGLGENIVILPSSPRFSLSYGLVERFQNSWMYSEGHRKNLLTPDYRKFGFGIAANPYTGKVYAVQNFQ